jgi:hypothetical protein
MLCMRPMCDSHLLLSASSQHWHCSLRMDSPHFLMLLEAQSVLVFVVLLVVVVQIVYFLAEEADLKMVLVVVLVLPVASGRCF